MSVLSLGAFRFAGAFRLDEEAAEAEADVAEADVAGAEADVAGAEAAGAGAETSLGDPLTVRAKCSVVRGQLTRL